jgi:signal peptidase I
MLDTLQINDRIIVNELVPNVVPIERGDVVVFRDPGGWLGPVEQKTIPFTTQVTDWFLSAFGVTAPDSDVHLVKRVIGIAGDHVKCCDANHKLTVNGVELTEPYIKKGESPSAVEFDVVVPADSIWVMGDNRGNSEDSRFHKDLPSKGFVNKKFIVGRAFLITFPFAHFSWLDNYSSVFKDVPNP